MRQFDLVQRLEQLPSQPENTNQTGESSATIGASSPMDRDTDPIWRAGLRYGYMGSSEFENGAIAESAHRIVSNMGRLAVVTDTLMRPTYKELVHFVCTDEQAGTILPVWHDWSQNPTTRERPHYFKDADEDIVVYEYDITVAWWALNEDLLWTRDEALAEEIAGGFTQRKRELFAQQSLPKRMLSKVIGEAP